MFRRVPLSIIGSLFTVNSAMVYVILKFHKWVRIISVYMCTIYNIYLNFNYILHICTLVIIQFVKFQYDIYHC